MFPEWPGSGQCLPERQRLQLSFGGNSTTLVRRPYFRRGIEHSWRGRNLSILMCAQDSTTHGVSAERGFSG